MRATLQVKNKTDVVEVHGKVDETGEFLWTVDLPQGAGLVTVTMDEREVTSIFPRMIRNAAVWRFKKAMRISPPKGTRHD